MALDKRAWRCQKGHGAQEKGHGAVPCYFALDLTLSYTEPLPDFKDSRTTRPVADNSARSAYIAESYVRTLNTFCPALC